MPFLNVILVLVISSVYVDGAADTSCVERSSSGRTYMIAVMETLRNADVTGIYINVAADNDGHVNVSAPFIHLSYRYRLNVGVTTINLNSSVIATNNGTEHKGILLEADTDVMVTVAIDSSSNKDQEGYLALPIFRDGSYSYVVASWDPLVKYHYPSEFLVASAEDNNTVIITTNGSQHTIVLNNFETYQLKYKDVDPSGTFISASGPVSVFSGSQCAEVLFVTCQSLLEQLLPVSSWGKSYVAPALQSKHWNVVRVFTANYTASVMLSNSSSTRTLNLSSFDYTTIVYQDEPLWIQSDTPVQVVQYSTGLFGGGDGDPFMMTIPDVNSFLSRYMFKPNAIYSHDVHQPIFLTITIEQTQDTGLRLNRQTLRKIPKHDVVVTSHGNYSVITVQLTADVSYRLEHVTSGVTFGALLYGFPVSFRAYGYPIGMKLRNKGCLSAASTTYEPTMATSSLSSSKPVTLSTRSRTVSSSTMYQPSTSPMYQPSTLSMHQHLTSSMYQLSTSSTPQPSMSSMYQPSTSPMYQPSTSSMHQPSTSSMHQASTSSTHQPVTVQSGSTLACLACDDMLHVQYCDVIQHCHENEVCFLEKYTISGGIVRFRSGCTQQKECTDGPSHTGDVFVDGCKQCCSESYCNTKGCGESGLPPLDARGPMCYACSYVVDTNECTIVSLCNQGQVCRILEFPWGNLGSYYQLGCASEETCKTSSSPNVRSTPSCHQCCSGDFCNIKCTQTVNHGVPIIG